MEFLVGDAKAPLCAMGHVVESIGVDADLQIDGRSYHESCLKCCVCDVKLAEKCFNKHGRLYCSQHYYKDCSVHRCAGCKRGISPNDMVYKLRAGLVFHVSCHCCATCGRSLNPGEQILVDETSRTVACMSHFQEEAPCEPLPSCSVDAFAVDHDHFAEFHIKKEVDTYGYNYEGFSFADFCDDDSKLLKRRGPRTTIKQNQLDVLNEMFANTPKPSKHARAKLALETGLSMRVIQVWFQNRRSKERRLKHLCNYLRHYEQRGLIPPPIHFRHSDGIPTNEFGNFIANFDEDDEED